jgi:hypothetical protein
MAEFSTILEMVRNLGLAFSGVCGHLFGLEAGGCGDPAGGCNAATGGTRPARYVAELFNRTIGQLTDAKLEVRLGAIYTLRQIAKDFPDLAEPTFELLSTYLREGAGKYEGDEPPIDVREIMTTLIDHSVL